MIYNIDDEIRSGGRHRGETIREIARYDSGYIKDRIKKDKSFVISGQCFGELAQITAGHRDNWEKPKSPIKNIFHAIKTYGGPYLYDFNEDKDRVKNLILTRLYIMMTKGEASPFFSSDFPREEGYVTNDDSTSEEECCTTISLPQLKNNRYLGLSLVNVLSLEVVYDKESVKSITQLAYYNLSKSISSDNDCCIDDLPLHKEYGSVVGDRLYRIALLLERKESLYEAIQYIRQKEMEALGFDHVSWGPIEDDDSIDKMIFADLVALPQSVFDFDYPHFSVWLDKIKGKLVDCDNPQEKVIARGNELHEKVCTYIEDFVCVNQD